MPSSAENRPKRSGKPFRRRPASRPPVRGRDPGHHNRPEQTQAASSGLDEIYGLHAVEAALANPRRAVIRLWVSENAERRLVEALALRGLALPASTSRLSPRELDHRLGTATVHQGVLLETQALPEPDFAELRDAAHSSGPLLVLDQVTDPHNVGAILRSSAAFGCSGIVMTRRNSPPLTGALAKVASGALEIVPVALVPNLARALAELKAHGFTLIGLDGTASGALEAEALTGPVALVLGAEGKGLRQLTRLSCHRLARITTAGAFGSLNVSNAAAVALHLAALHRAGMAAFKPK